MKRMVNKDGKKFRQYQQNEQSHLILTYLTQKGGGTPLEIRVLAWDRRQNVAVLNPVDGFSITLS